MARKGLVLNIVGAILLAMYMYFWGRFALDINIGEFPVWATG